MEEFKPNSHKNKEKEPDRKKIAKVVTGPVKTKKKSSGQKLAGLFITEDISSVKNHMLEDVFIPAIKDTLYDAFTSGLGMLLGNNSPTFRGGRGTSSKSRESYTQYYNQSNTSRPATTNRGGRYDYDDVILDSRAEAEEVLDVLKEYIHDFGMVSLLELYESVGRPSNYMDSKYGWYELNSASVYGDRRNGYKIKFPRITLLD